MTEYDYSDASDSYDEEEDVYTPQSQNNPNKILQLTVQPTQKQSHKQRKKPKKLIAYPDAPLMDVNYSLCQKEGFHSGQPANLVCLNPQCKEKPSICVVCMQEEHVGHHIKPLKLLMQSSSRYFSRLSRYTDQVPSIKQAIGQSGKQMISKYESFGQQIKSTLQNIKNSIQIAHNKMIQQLDVNVKNNQILKTIAKLEQEQMDSKDFSELVGVLLAGIPTDIENQDDVDVDEDMITHSLQTISKKIIMQFDNKSTKVNLALNDLKSQIQKGTTQVSNIFTKVSNFKFSTELKHPSIQVIDDNHVRSTIGQNYHFALMQPSLETKKSQHLAFKIVTSSSNWLALGVCHKTTVSNNSYTFNYSTVGHGGYLLSANGGSWSSTDSSKNNIVSAFTFHGGQIIFVHYDSDNSKVHFKKKSSGETYQLSFIQKQNDPLHFCVLFFYKKDEIQHLGKAKDFGFEDVTNVPATQPVLDESYHGLFD